GVVEAREIVLCGGAINSPQLLQLSGVGNARELQELDIDVVADLPGVGENLQDHLEVYVQYASKLPVSVAPSYRWRNRPKVGLQWLLFKSGPGATNHFEAGGFVRGNAGELSPGPSVETDEEILDWVARDAETALHPSCTCRMGTDHMSVVDPATMRVRGVDGLRVVDASMMPFVPNGNIYAPVM